MIKNNNSKKYLLTAILLFIVLFAAGCTASVYKKDVDSSETFLLPIAKGLFGEGSFWDFIVYPMAFLMNVIAKYIVGNNYALTIIIATILVRSLAWPIYGKTNDMSLKMRIMGPEQAEIEKKYEGKTDRESMTRKQMEMMALYKKYKINFFGCLTPLLQMPIFLAFYETLRRIPSTTMQFLASVNNTLYDKKGNEIVVNELFVDFSDLKTKLFGIDLLSNTSPGGWQKWGIYIIAALVGITQLGIQLYSQYRQKLLAKTTNNVPAYRMKEKTDQQKQQENIMKIMIYAMPLMMVIFTVTNTAALGWYWVVGNIYTFAQTVLSSRNSEKKIIKLREKFNSERDFAAMRRY